MLFSGKKNDNLALFFLIKNGKVSLVKIHTINTISFRTKEYVTESMGMKCLRQSLLLQLGILGRIRGFVAEGQIHITNSIVNHHRI